MQEFLQSNQRLVIYTLLGLVFIAIGIILYKGGIFEPATKIEVLNSTTEADNTSEITVELAGEVVKPGVYKLPNNSRIEDVLILGGGFSVSADRNWTDKYLNRAAKLIDGQKIYIPKVGEQTLGASASSVGGDQTTSSTFSSQNSGTTNINTASLSELDKLPGIGPVYGQNIIDHRPYSTVEELLSKGALKKNVYEKIKDMVSIY